MQRRLLDDRLFARFRPVSLPTGVEIFEKRKIITAIRKVIAI
jgi:hypothetical protein